MRNIKIKFSFFQRFFVNFYIVIDIISDKFGIFLERYFCIDIDKYFKIVNKFFDIRKNICQLLRLPINNSVLDEMIIQITWELKYNQNIINRLEELFSDYINNPEDFESIEKYLKLEN